MGPGIDMQICNLPRQFVAYLLNALESFRRTRFNLVHEGFTLFSNHAHFMRALVGGLGEDFLAPRICLDLPSLAQICPDLPIPRAQEFLVLPT